MVGECVPCTRAGGEGACGVWTPPDLHLPSNVTWGPLTHSSCLFPIHTSTLEGLMADNE